jgi:hypothetical protein
MAEINLKSSCYFFVLFCVLTGCSSLERADGLRNSHLQIGTSTKTDVVNTIGLPRKTEFDEKSGQEVWYYTGHPVSKGYFVPSPLAAVSSGNIRTVYWTDVGQKNILGNDPVMLTCVFDSAGQLIFVKHKE